MTMADRNTSHLNEDAHPVTDYTDQLRDTPLNDEPSLAPMQSDSHPMQDRNLTFSNSPLHRERLPTRDSGYGTDLSPATVVTPSSSTTSAQQFVFDSSSHHYVQRLLNRTPSPPQGNTMPQLASACNVHSQDNTLPQTAPAYTSFPQVVRVSTSKSEVAYRGFNVSSRSVSEFSDISQVHFGCEINNEEGNNVGHNDSCNSGGQLPPPPPPPQRLRNDFDLTQSLCSLHLLDDDEDDEDDFAKRGDSSKHIRINNDKTVLTRRLSMRSRRFCSEEVDDDDSFLGACGGCDQSRITPDFETCQRRDQRSRSLSEYTLSGDIVENPRTRIISDSETTGRGTPCIPFDSFSDPDSPLYSSQGFQPGFFDSDSKDNDSDAVFYFDHDSFEGEKDTRVSQASPGTVHSVTFSEEGSIQSRSLHSRQRRSGVAASFPASSRSLSTRFHNTGSVTVSTQTPHATSLMIQRILVSNLPLPNEARGTAVSRLRHLSESGVPVPLRQAPLPDVVMSAGRDRSQSVPNMQALSPRQRAAREVGQELRRLSDEFNCRRNLSPVHEEFDGHPASYPTMRPRYLRNTLTQFGSLLMDTFRGRQNP